MQAALSGLLCLMLLAGPVAASGAVICELKQDCRFDLVENATCRDEPNRLVSAADLSALTFDGRSFRVIGAERSGLTVRLLARKDTRQLILEHNGPDSVLMYSDAKAGGLIAIYRGPCTGEFS